MARVKISRNDPCPCGSGLKYKKCCIGKIHNISNISKKPQSRIISPVEPKLQLLPSYIKYGYRYRPVFNGVYKRPEKETFHEFLLHLVKWTFGDVWWKKQVSTEDDKRHDVFKWSKITYEYQAENMNEDNKIDHQVYEADAPGPVWALITLGYDLFCLSAKNKLPERLLKRLKNKRSFQSARYEVLVAALMMRYGFDIHYLDDKEYATKHYEFIAQAKNSDLQIAIEAKSRVRNEIYDSTRESRAYYELLSTAIKQGPRGNPFIIFIDVNSPLTPDIDISEKPWMLDMQRAIGKMETPTKENPELYSMIVITNYSFHLEDPRNAIFAGEYGCIVPEYSRCPIPDMEWVDTLMPNLKKYASVPVEI